MSCKPHNAYVVSTPAAAGLPNEYNEEAAGSGADKDHARVEKLNAYIRSLKQHITDQKQISHNYSQRISELETYITSLHRDFDHKMAESVKLSQRISHLEHVNQTLRQNHKPQQTDKIHEWMIKELQSKLEQANEAHEEQLAAWMQQVNALQKRIHMLERRSTDMCPSLRR